MISSVVTPSASSAASARRALARTARRRSAARVARTVESDAAAGARDLLVARAVRAAARTRRRGRRRRRGACGSRSSPGVTSAPPRSCSASARQPAGRSRLGADPGDAARRRTSSAPRGDEAPATCDLLVRHPDDDRRVRELPRPADDRRARHGVPAAERAAASGSSSPRASSSTSGLFARLRARTPAGSTTCRSRSQLYDPGRNIDFYALGLIFNGARVDDRRDQLHRHDLQAARARDVVQPDAALLLRDPRRVVRRCSSRCRR